MFKTKIVIDNIVIIEIGGGRVININEKGKFKKNNKKSHYKSY